MKRIAIFLLAFAMVFSLFGCESSAEPLPDTTETPAVETTTVTENTTVVEIPTVTDDTTPVTEKTYLQKLANIACQPHPMDTANIILFDIDCDETDELIVGELCGKFNCQYNIYDIETGNITDTFTMAKTFNEDSGDFYDMLGKRRYTDAETDEQYYVSVSLDVNPNGGTDTVYRKLIISDSRKLTFLPETNIYENSESVADKITYNPFDKNGKDTFTEFEYAGFTVSKKLSDEEWHEQIENLLDRSDFGTKYPHLAALEKYLVKLYNDKALYYYPSSEAIVAITLFDYDKDGKKDALIECEPWNGIPYYLIKNIDNPNVVYLFYSFDEADILTDGEKFLIRYEEQYGHNVYATHEVNYLYLGDEIEKISYVHFSGTSAPEEFFSEINGEKTVYTEAEWKSLIEERDSSLSEFSTIDDFILASISEKGLSERKN